MKKIIRLVPLSALILALSLTLLIFSACGEAAEPNSTTLTDAVTETTLPTTEPIPISPPPAPPEYPEDMVPTTKTASVREARNVELTVTVHGYESKSIGREFFLLHNRPILVEVTLNVTLDPYSADIIERTMPTSCRGLAYPKENAYYRHNHEISGAISDKAGLPLVRIIPPDICCPTAIETWRPKSNTPETYYFLFTAGIPKEDFPYEEMTADALSEMVFSESLVELYSPEYYKWDGNGFLVDTFTGIFSFPFTRTGIHSCEIETHTASVTIELPILYPIPIE